MSTRTDIYHGRRGGNWLPDDYEEPALATAKRCVECGQPMLVGQRQRHHACDRESIVAERCTCAPGCTDQLVGDGEVDCDPSCVPCRLKRNVLHGDVVEWRRSKK